MDKSGNMSMCSWETKMFDTRADLPLPYLLPLRFRLSPPSAVGDPVRPSDISAPGIMSSFRGAPSTSLGTGSGDERSEEHTSELQSLAYLVCRLLLEKKKKTIDTLVSELQSESSATGHK